MAQTFTQPKWGHPEAARHGKCVSHIQVRDSTMSPFTRDWLRLRGVDVIHVPCPESLKLELRECFDIVDVNNDDTIDAYELYQVFNLLGIPVSWSWCLNLIESHDEDGNKTLDYGEFERIMVDQWFVAQAVTNKSEAEEEQNGGSLDHVDIPHDMVGKRGADSAPMSISLALTNYRRRAAMDALLVEYVPPALSSSLARSMSNTGLLSTGKLKPLTTKSEAALKFRDKLQKRTDLAKKSAEMIEMDCPSLIADKWMKNESMLASVKLAPMKQLPVDTVRSIHNRIRELEVENEMAEVDLLVSPQRRVSKSIFNPNPGAPEDGLEAAITFPINSRPLDLPALPPQHPVPKLTSYKCTRYSPLDILTISGSETPLVLPAPTSSPPPGCNLAPAPPAQRHQCANWNPSPSLLALPSLGKLGLKPVPENPLSCEASSLVVMSPHGVKETGQVEKEVELVADRGEGLLLEGPQGQPLLSLGRGGAVRGGGVGGERKRKGKAAHLQALPAPVQERASLNIKTNSSSKESQLAGGDGKFFPKRSSLRVPRKLEPLIAASVSASTSQRHSQPHQARLQPTRYRPTPAKRALEGIRFKRNLLKSLNEYQSTNLCVEQAA